MRFLDRLGRQPKVIVVGWILAAALTVLVGIVGIGIVGAGLTPRQGTPISQDDVLRALGESGAPTPDITEISPEQTEAEGPATSPAPSSAPSLATLTVQSFATRGGTVMATCEGITAMSPAQGFQVHEQNAREGEFRGIRDNHNRVKVELACPNGTPELRTRDDG